MAEIAPCSQQLELLVCWSFGIRSLCTAPSVKPNSLPSMIYSFLLRACETVFDFCQSIFRSHSDPAAIAGNYAFSGECPLS